MQTPTSENRHMKRETALLQATFNCSDPHTTITVPNGAQGATDKSPSDQGVNANQTGWTRLRENEWEPVCYQTHSGNVKIGACNPQVRRTIRDGNFQLLNRVPDEAISCWTSPKCLTCPIEDRRCARFLMLQSVANQLDQTRLPPVLPQCLSAS